MLLTNHGHLTEQLKSDEPVDFTDNYPWLRNQLNEEKTADPAWAELELDTDTLRKRNANKYIIGRMPWNRS
jgi:hypothetical protein